MKKIVTLILITAVLCSNPFLLCRAYADTNPWETDLNYSGLSDPDLIAYLEDKVYMDLVQGLNSDAYYVEKVEAVYISKNYLEELAYNSQANIFFGYTLAELEEQFQGTPYLFTMGDDGKTVVKAFENYDDTYEKVLENVVVGSGVILLCVTVSLVTAGGAAPAVSAVFAASAQTGTAIALSSGVISGVMQGIVSGIQENDFSQVLKDAALEGSESFRWGAIAGMSSAHFLAL